MDGSECAAPVNGALRCCYSLLFDELTPLRQSVQAVDILMPARKGQKLPAGGECDELMRQRKRDNLITDDRL